jgi:hypothetical protein
VGEDGYRKQPVNTGPFKIVQHVSDTRVTMQAVPNEGTPLAMTGMYRVAEQKLGELAPEKLKELTQKGILVRVYAHLISLSNFGRLLDRRAALVKQAPTGVSKGSKKLN